MVDYVEPIMQVLTGGGAEGLTWEVLAREEPGGRFLTVIRRVQGASAAESGFKGLKLEPGQLIRYWIGKADGTPAFIVARAAPEVESIIAIGASSVEYPLQMSNLIEQFSLRFGATPIPASESLVEVRTIPASAIAPPRSVPQSLGRDWRTVAGWVATGDS